MGARTQDMKGVDLEQQLETEWFYIEDKGEETDGSPGDKAVM